MSEGKGGPRSPIAGKHAAVMRGVEAWEEQVKIPTYLIGNPDPNPQFYFGAQSQGAQQRVYPYPSYDVLTTEKVDKPYNMVYLENQYIKIGILPESGGRIFYSEDKTNGYAFFYNQRVIKPALISLLGAWISGGVEWDLPHHHRATSFVPVQYTIEANADGSKTVWVGELELRDQMQWAVGLTLHPGKSYLEAKFRMVNRTPVPTSMLCFSNVGVHAGVEYQIIFPPSTQYWTNHKKPSYQPWTEQLSWLKNHPTSGSWFAYNTTDDFMAGYDHGVNAGTMAIADHNVVPGKKFFTWGTQNTAEFNRLTDEDGPYLELMVGAYSDNQPDYSWIAPFETRAWSQYWYPFHTIDGVKCANTEAAVNLEVAGGKAKVGFFSTSERRRAVASVKWKDQVLLNETIAISPGHAFTREIALPAGADEHDVRAVLLDEGKELVAYSPVRAVPVTPPKPVPTAYPDPLTVKTTEELFLIGQRIEQFRTPFDPNNPVNSINNASPEVYWKEALKRDPGDIRVNTAMGINAIKAGRYADAQDFLRTALVRATDRITTPKDGEPYYYLGVALKGEGKLEAAFDAFSHATWSGAWRGPAYFEMAEIAAGMSVGAAVSGGGKQMGRADLSAEAALSYVNSALDANAQNTRAWALKAALLRHARRREEALACTEAIRKIDPLDVHGLAERYLITRTPQDAKAMIVQISALPQTALEVAGDYCNAGLWADGQAFLDPWVWPNQAEASWSVHARGGVSTLVMYYLEYFAERLHQKDRAEAYGWIASTLPSDYAFPFQMEMIPVLEAAMAANPKDSRAPYYLGNLLYDWQPERAVKLWEKSVELGADFPVVYRNLAMVYARAGERRAKVQATLEKGVQFGGNAMIFDQLDRIYEENKMPPEQRLAVLQAHQGVLDRPEVLTREINLAVFAGKPELAISLLKSRYFRAWEGRNGYSVGDAWVNANIVAGRQQLAARQYDKAVGSFQAALTLPSTLAEEGGGSITGRTAEVSYYLGNTYEEMGDLAKARTTWTGALAGAPLGGGRSTPPGGGPGGRGRGNLMGGGPGVRVAAADPYFQGLAAQKLGDSARATALYQEVLAAGNEIVLRPMPEPGLLNMNAQQRSGFADGHYLLALGNLGLGNKEKAKEELRAALEITPDHLGAQEALSMLP